MSGAGMRTPPVAVVTGGTAGVGRATALAFARAGYRVAVLARGARGLAETLAALQAVPDCQALALAVDMADAGAVEQAATRIEAELGPIEVWVNSAMVTVFGPVDQLSAEEIRRVTEVTYLGTVHGTQAALRRMRPRNRGTLVQVGSALAYRAIPLQSAYCAAKFAIRGFTDALRCELRHDGSAIRVSMVQLPAHDTPQFDWARNKMARRPQPVPPIHSPEVAARAILRAARTAPRELWLGWPSLKAILGGMLAPGLADRLLARQAWDGQMTREAADPARPDNLFAPVERPASAGGRFGGRARDHATGVSETRLRQGALAAGLALATLAALALVRRGGR